MKTFVLALFSALSIVAHAANTIVTVAPNGLITYSPSSVMAAVGDTIEFQFASNVLILNLPSDV
jgi:plastocyanin